MYYRFVSGSPGDYTPAGTTVTYQFSKSNQVTTTSEPGAVSVDGPSGSVWFGAGSAQSGQTNPSFDSATHSQPYTVSNSGYTTGFASVLTDPITYTWDGNAFTVQNPNSPTAPLRKELMLLLMNNTGLPQLVRWGDRMLTLLPGMNQIRYDGPVDNTGMPTVRPSDFQGTSVTSPAGHTLLAASLEKGIDNSVGWGAPPKVPPTSPTLSPKVDQYEIAVAPTPTTAGTLVIRHASGVISLIGMPPTAAPTPSNTTGPSAVLSNPTAPKPPQTSSNTTTNITNNVTNNTTNSTTNVINDDGSSKDPATVTNAKEMDNIQATADDGKGLSVMTSLTAARDAFQGKQSTALQSVISKFSGFDKILSVTAVPKIMTFSHNMDLGQFGSRQLTIDFNKTPFPQVRNASLVVITLLMAMAFMKRVTI